MRVRYKVLYRKCPGPCLLSSGELPRPSSPPGTYPSGGIPSVFHCFRPLALAEIWRRWRPWRHGGMVDWRARHLTGSFIEILGAPALRLPGSMRWQSFKCKLRQITCQEGTNFAVSDRHPDAPKFALPSPSLNYIRKCAFSAPHCEIHDPCPVAHDAPLPAGGAGALGGRPASRLLVAIGGGHLALLEGT